VSFLNVKANSSEAAARPTQWALFGYYGGKCLRYSVEREYPTDALDGSFPVDKNRTNTAFTDIQPTHWKVIFRWQKQREYNQLQFAGAPAEDEVFPDPLG